MFGVVKLLVVSSCCSFSMVVLIMFFCRIVMWIFVGCE